MPVVHGELLTKWRGVEADIRTESEVLARCLDGTEFCPSAARKFLAIIGQGRARTGRARIGVINRAINLAIRPMSESLGDFAISVQSTSCRKVGH
jgi:hypothetical protein